MGSRLRSKFSTAGLRLDWRLLRGYERVSAGREPVSKVKRYGQLCYDTPLMSRAFVKEDVDLPERSGRKRSASGLPPGATNYITARGAKHLRDELQKLRAANANSERVAELEQILASVHVVDPPDPASNSVAFGATVTVQDKKGRTETYTIVGVDELDLEPDAVSWISPIGKALLAADMGEWITLGDGRPAKIVKIERKSDT
jgi:transcription elongation GreA/GreB family factor